MVYASKGSLSKDDKKKMLKDIFYAFTFSNFTDFDLYFNNKTDNIIKINMTGLVKLSQNFTSFGKWEFISFLSKFKIILLNYF